MLSCLLVLVALLALAATASPLPRAGPCDWPTANATTLFVPTTTLTPSPTPTTDDCSDPTPTTVPPTYVPPTSPAPTSVPPTSVPPTSVPPTSPVPSTPVTTSSPVSAVPTTVANVTGGPYDGGYATYFYQNGNPGACGTVHQDSDFICAMDQARYNPGLCGQQVQITNLDTSQSITVTIADDCPTCDNANSIDLSVAAFQALAPLSEGIFPIEWVYVS